MVMRYDREECYEKGEQYQAFIQEELRHHGIIIYNYTTKEEQYNIGENKFGLEIKFDDKVFTYDKKGRLYIETHEKAYIRDGEYAPSGILRRDNTWLYGVGNYNFFYIFSKPYLRRLYRSGISGFSNVSWIHWPKPTLTSKGFCIPLEKADIIAAKIINFKN